MSTLRSESARIIRCGQSGCWQIVGDINASKNAVPAPWFGVSSHVWILLMLAILFHIALSQMTIGRYIYAIGSNPNAAEVSGVRISRYGIGLFTLNGVVVGIAGVLAASRFGTATVASANSTIVVRTSAEGQLLQCGL